MKLGILSRSKKIYSTRRLVEAAEKRGHEVKIVDVLKCYVNITANNPHIYYKNDFEKFKLESRISRMSLGKQESCQNLV